LILIEDEGVGAVPAVVDRTEAIRFRVRNRSLELPGELTKWWCLKKKMQLSQKARAVRKNDSRALRLKVCFLAMSADVG
jgi:hypothetical protein